VKIVRAGLLPHQHHLRSLARQLFGLVRTEHHLALGGARAAGKPVARTAVSAFGSTGRMQQLIQLFRRHPLNGDRAIDQLSNTISVAMRTAARRAFAGARLQHPEFAALIVNSQSCMS